MSIQEVRAEKFTPGKLTYVYGEAAIRDEHGRYIAHMQTRGEPHVDEYGNLLAASPALYAALTRAHVVIRDAITLRVPIDGDAEGTLKAVEAALRLALDGAQ